MKSNAAYDLRTFTSVPNVKVVKTQKKKKVGKLSFKRIAGLYFVLLIALMSFTVYNQAVLTETRSRVNSSRKQLTTLENTYDTLNAKLENMVSLKAAEEYATGVLGLVKIDNSQVVYVDLETENVIEVGEADTGLLGSLKAAFASVADFFGVG